MSNTDSPLHIAVKNNNIEIVKLLLENQCNVHAVNTEGLTPLQLATQTGNAEMVALLFQHGAGNPPKPSQQVPNEPPRNSPPGADLRKQRITFWAITFSVSLVLLMLTSSIPPGNASGAISVILGILAISSLVAYPLCLYFFVFRIWEEVPADLTRATPQKAAGFSLIPVFYLYWNYVAFRGLYLGMNESLERLGAEKRFSLNGITGVCCFWLFYGILRLITIPMGGGSPLLDLVYCVTTVWMFWNIRTNVAEFIDIKSRVTK